MKKLMCEMCGSGDMIKDGDYFVCQSCGMKYTPEAAKKMMVEGTVTVDRSSELQNIYTLARRARDQGNIENARKYYEEAVKLDPNNWEANFFSVYYQQLDCKIYQIASAANGIRNSLDSTFNLIKDSSLTESEKSEAYKLVSVYCRLAVETLHSSAYNHYNNNITVNGVQTEYDERKRACAQLIYYCAGCLKIFGESKSGFELFEYLLKSKFRDVYKKDQIVAEMKEYDPSYDPTTYVKDPTPPFLKWLIPLFIVLFSIMYIIGSYLNGDIKL